MRLKVIFGERGDSFNISRDYRRCFVSFMKKVFERSDKFDSFYSSKKLKPFVFSVFLGGQLELIKKDENEEIKVKPPFSMIFSTGDFDTFAFFYNGLLDIKKENSGLLFEDKIFPIKDISLMRILKINEDSVIFKTVGICILTDPEESSKNFDKWFIIPNEKNIEKFNEVLKKRMLKKYEMVNEKKIETEIEFVPKSIKEVYVKHYGGYLKGFKGVFILKSHPEMLQFIYDYGLGVRTGQGFGLLDIVNDP